MDYYAILGVHPTAEDIVIRAAYKALAQRYHPDRFNGSQDEAHRRMSELTKAYDVLADPVRRTKYDRRRQAYTQSVATYFNGTSKDTRLAIDPRDRRSPAAMRRRSRIALSALMVAVVALSAFNIYQYSAQLRDWLNPGAPVQPAIEAKPRATPDASAPVAAGSPASVAIGSAASVAADSTASGTTQAAAATARNLPIDQPDVGGPVPARADVETPAMQRPDAAPAVEPPVQKERAEAPRQLAADAAPTVVAPAVVAPAVVAPAAVVPTSVIPTAKPPAEAPVTAQPKRTASRAIAATNVPASRPTSAPPPAEGSAQCNDTVAALGLCSPPTTARNK